MRKVAVPRRARAKPHTVDVRGESTITLEGVTYRLRPSREAVTTIEEQTDHALLELVRLGNAGGLSLDALGIIGAELIKAGADEADDAARHVGASRIADLIYEEGVMKAQAIITMVLLGSATGGRTATGEAKAAIA